MFSASIESQILVLVYSHMTPKTFAHKQARQKLVDDLRLVKGILAN